MIWLLIVKGVALAYASYDSIRSRYWLGLFALAAMVYATVAFAAGLLDPSTALPPGALLAAHPLAFYASMIPLSLGPMAWAWRQRAELPEDSPRAVDLDRVGMAFLANGLLDAAVLTLVGIGGYLASRSDF